MSASSPYPYCLVRRRPPAPLRLSLLLWPAWVWPLAAQAGGSRAPVNAPGLLAVLAVLVLACAGLLILWRRTQRRLQRALDGGRVAEQSLRQLLDNAPAAIWRTDPHGRLVFANRRLCEALGRSEAELQALVRFFDAFDPVTAARMAGRDAQALARAEPVLGQESRTDAGGRRRHYDLIKVRVLDGSGRPEGVISDRPARGRIAAAAALRAGARTPADLPPAGQGRPDPAWAGARELPLDGHPAVFVLVAHRGWLQQIRAWLDADGADAAPPTRPARGLGRWLSSLPPNVRESEAGRAVWRLHQQLHEQFDAMLAAHAAGDSAAAGAQRAGLIDIGERFVRDLDALLAAMAEPTREA